MPCGIDDIHGIAVMIYRLRRMIYTPLGVIWYGRADVQCTPLRIKSHYDGRGGACSSRTFQTAKRTQIAILKQDRTYDAFPSGVSHSKTVDNRFGVACHAARERKKQSAIATHRDH